ncbi:hypothetical protein F4819DRAFT_507564 [Hypoxylon fuscum]|nr:hypothetical protein F4819DRAFT_507564 [Hypoxylon fuscum]
MASEDTNEAGAANVVNDDEEELDIDEILKQAAEYQSGVQDHMTEVSRHAKDVENALLQLQDISASTIRDNIRIRSVLQEELESMQEKVLKLEKIRKAAQEHLVMTDEELIKNEEEFIKNREEAFKNTLHSTRPERKKMWKDRAATFMAEKGNFSKGQAEGMIDLFAPMVADEMECFLEQNAPQKGENIDQMLDRVFEQFIHRAEYAIKLSIQYGSYKISLTEAEDAYGAHLPALRKILNFQGRKDEEVKDPPKTKKQRDKQKQRNKQKEKKKALKAAAKEQQAQEVKEDNVEASDEGSPSARSEA